MGESFVLRTRNIVLSNAFLIGKGSVYSPRLADREVFTGPVQHTDEYRTSEPYKDKDVVIVGSDNSTHDVAKDLAENGAKSVTILQKSPIVFIDFETMGPVMSMMYQGQMAIEAADFLDTGMPTALTREMFKPVMAYLVQSMGEKNNILEKKGYALRKDPDLIQGAFEKRGRNFYMDHSKAYDRIVKDKIKIVRGEATGFTKDRLVARYGEDQFVLPAQGVVLATGYQNADAPKKYADSGFNDRDTAAKLENVGDQSVDAER